MRCPFYFPANRSINHNITLKYFPFFTLLIYLLEIELISFVLTGHWLFLRDET